MVRPVERFEINLAGAQATRPETAPDRGRVRAAFGPVGLAAAACLGAVGVLIAQRILGDSSLLGLTATLVRALPG